MRNLAHPVTVAGVLKGCDSEEEEEEEDGKVGGTKRGIEGLNEGLGLPFCAPRSDSESLLIRSD